MVSLSNHASLPPPSRRNIIIDLEMELFPFPNQIVRSNIPNEDDAACRENPFLVGDIYVNGFAPVSGYAR